MLLLEDGARRREEHRQEQQAAAVGLREELALLACHFASVHHVVVATRARTLRSDPAAMAATDGGALLEACPDPLASLPPDVVELLATLGGAGVLARLACVSRAGRALAARGGAWEAAEEQAAITAVKGSLGGNVPTAGCDWSAKAQHRCPRSFHC